MSEWNFLDPRSKDKLLSLVRHEAEQMQALTGQPETWEAPTGAGHWQVRDVVGHLVDTTESYFVAFDAARGRGDADEPLGLAGMATYVDEGAQAFRGTPQAELRSRLRGDFDQMMGIFDEIGEDEWANLQVPHKYMGPLPVPFYAIFQLVDYTMHGWDIREGSGRAHAMSAEAADFLVPLGFILWQATAQCQPDDEAYSIGVRITSGHNAGETRLDVSPDGVAFEPASLEGVPTVLEFDPASFILTAYGRINAGAASGDVRLTERFLNLCFRI